MKDFDRKDVFSILNAKDARQYLGKKGYFACTLSALQKQVEKNILSSLDEVNLHIDYPFITHYADCNLFFLPADKVRQVEEPKKWRPFKDFGEFSKTLNKQIGSEILYRNKDYPLRYIHTTIMGYIEHELYEDLIQIGTGTLKFSDYFKQIEIWNGERWQPFGVEE